jgi:hypothetical protein
MTTLPGLAGEIEALIGLDLTTKLLRAKGGVQINIPHRERVTGSALAAIIGDQAAEAMFENYGAGAMWLPMASFRGAKRRKADAVRMLRAGASLQDVALACDVASRTVSNYRAEIEAEAGSRQFALPFDRPDTDLAE